MTYMTQEDAVERLNEIIANDPRLSAEVRDEALLCARIAFDIDPLTLLDNRSSLNRQLSREKQIARETREGLAAIMVDVDDFKSYNDTYGHEQGDEALRYVGQILKLGLREGDIVARYGGEEIVVLLPGTDIEGATIAAERIVRRFPGIGVGEDYAGKPEARDKQYAPGKGWRDITVSVGVSAYPNPSSNIELLLGDADSALYQSKVAGKNMATAFKEAA